MAGCRRVMTGTENKESAIVDVGNIKTIPEQE
jgi:hypothetical protein